VAIAKHPADRDPPRAAAPALSGQPSSGRAHSPVDLRVRVEVGPAKPKAVRDRHLIQALPGLWTGERDTSQSVPDRSAVRAADKTQKTKVEAVGATVRPNTGLGMMAAIAPTTSK
jgi:hypothetical protein